MTTREGKRRTTILHFVRPGEGGKRSAKPCSGKKRKGESYRFPLMRRGKEESQVKTRVRSFQEGRGEKPRLYSVRLERKKRREKREEATENGRLILRYNERGKKKKEGSILTCFMRKKEEESLLQGRNCLSDKKKRKRGEGSLFPSFWRGRGGKEKSSLIQACVIPSREEKKEGRFSL